MILVDTGVWVDHLKTGEPALATLLNGGLVLGHAWVLGELALGGLANREEVLQLLGQLPQAPLAAAAETLGFIERHELAGTGIGYVDAQLLASTLLAGDAQLWTRDRKLAATAARLGIAASPTAQPSPS